MSQTSAVLVTFLIVGFAATGALDENATTCEAPLPISARTVGEGGVKNGDATTGKSLMQVGRVVGSAQPREEATPRARPPQDDEAAQQLTTAPPEPAEQEENTESPVHGDPRDWEEKNLDETALNLLTYKEDAIKDAQLTPTNPELSAPNVARNILVNGHICPWSERRFWTGVFIWKGFTVNGASYYKLAGSGHSTLKYLYYDHACDGDSRAGWFIHNREPNLERYQDLDFDSGCSPLAFRDTPVDVENDHHKVPDGETWRVQCKGGWAVATIHITPVSLRHYNVQFSAPNNDVCVNAAKEMDALWNFVGYTNTGSSYFKATLNSHDYYLFFDPACKGTETGLGPMPRWVVDIEPPLLDRDHDLDNDGRCSYLGDVDVWGWNNEWVPTSREWYMWCAPDWHQFLISTTREILPTPMPTSFPTQAPTPAPTPLNIYTLQDELEELKSRVTDLEGADR